MKKEDYYVVTEYKLFGFTSNRPFSLSEVGAIWVFIILTFPIWIWFFFIYKFFVYIGKKLNGVKVEKYKVKKERYYL